MNINLHIQELILEGIDIPRSQRELLQTVIESELSRLFTENGVPNGFQEGGNIADLPANLQLAKNAHPQEMGQQIAQSIYGGLSQ
jgi:hypothetical protein